MFSAGSPWPVLSDQEVPWHARLPSDVVPRSVRLRHSGPYRAAVVPLIATAMPTLDAATSALAD